MDIYFVTIFSQNIVKMDILMLSYAYVQVYFRHIAMWGSARLLGERTFLTIAKLIFSVLYI